MEFKKLWKSYRKDVLILAAIFLFTLIFTLLRKQISSLVNSSGVFFFIILLLPFVFLYVIIKIAFNKELIPEKKSAEIYRNIEIFIAIFTFIILSGQLFVFILQANLMSKQTDFFDSQTQILERSNPPYEPWIEIIPDYEDLTIPAFELVDTRNFDNGWAVNRKWARIHTTIYNFGKMDSQHIYCSYNQEKNNDSYYMYMSYNSTTNNINNIPAGNSIRATLHIMSDGCRSDERELCDKNLIQTGKQEIILSCKCNACKDQRYFDKVIEFCIYNQNKTAECPDNWNGQFLN